MKRSFHLSENDIRNAIQHWINSGSPDATGKSFSIMFNVDRPSNPSPTDRGNGITATAMERDESTVDLLNKKAETVIRAQKQRDGISH
jgi:hypothetical protein